MNYDIGQDMVAIEALIGMLVGVYAIAMIWGVVAYVLKAMGIFTIAKRRQIRRPWLAWIPVCDMYLLGCISDQYQQVARLKNTRRRVVLLVLSIINAIASLIMVIMLVSMLVNIVGSVMYNSDISPEALIDQVVGPVMSLYSIASVVEILTIVYMVFQYVALHDLFASCNPDNKTLFVVLCIFFNFLIPIFVFAQRNRDDGMRRPQANPYNGWMPPQQNPQEPWQE